MTPKILAIRLLSDTTFSSGRGSPGEVDIDVCRDEHGLPMIPGKIIHGLLRDEWFAMEPHFLSLKNAAERLLGVEGDLNEISILRIGNARLPADVILYCRHAANANKNISMSLLFRTLTGIRTQTAQDRATGAPEKTTLRQARVIRSGITFEAPLSWLASPSTDDVMLLGRLALAVRHAGVSRTRGRGHISLSIHESGDITHEAASLEEIPS